MNEDIEKFARDFLKENLGKLNEGEIQVFRQMYSPGFPDLPIDKVVDKMPKEKLDWAMSQVKNTLPKPATIVAKTDENDPK